MQPPRVSCLPQDGRSSASDPKTAISLSSHQEYAESRSASADLTPAFKREAELSLHAPSLQTEPWSPSLTLPSTATRCGGLWGQVRCKQIQYTLHCIAPQGSQWSYSRGTNHFGSRFACFFLLYFPKACTSPRRERHPATHRRRHTGLFIFGRLRLIEWAPFWDSTSTGLLSV